MSTLSRVVPRSSLLVLATACASPSETVDPPDTPEAVGAPLTVGPLAGSGAKVALENLDQVPYADRLILSVLLHDRSSQITHGTATVRLRSTGTEPLVVSSISVSPPFVLASTHPLPLTLAPGEAADVGVALPVPSIAPADKTVFGTLALGTNIGTSTTVPVELAGTQTAPQGSNEPTLAQIANVFGYSTVILRPGERLQRAGLRVATGDEVLSSYWRAADPSQPVRFYHLGSWHTAGSGVSTAWHARGSTTLRYVVGTDGFNAQTLLPRKRGSTVLPASGSFRTSEIFGIKIKNEFSDDTLNDATKDMAKGCRGPCGHHVRFFPAKDRSGAVLAGTYIVAEDSDSGNYDYNDVVILVSNISPVGS